ncbi:MAG: pyridoxal phosphate-dependent aminotransferase [Slackia piriformis]|uniref:cysteine-S-conjugate beta-lyase n=1 Tax=Slackia piriformis TaxID=626934 RepID=A0A943Z762_9ACTN|nr:pyridoxal phosphate-dependent aminotransferase [Slackia piriformis]
MYDFETLVDRRGTGASKWVGVEDGGVLEDIVPLSVADMEFVAPPEVRRALHEVVDRGVFGYQNADDLYFDACRRWYERRQGWVAEQEWLVPAQGVVQALCAAIMVFAREGEGVIVQEPVYYPFRAGVEVHGRRVVNNPLIEGRDADGRLAYSIDFDGLEAAAAGDDVRLMLFCNPHNPVGRVWSANEVRRVAEICKRHDVILVSDEIHGDLIMGARPLTSVMTLSDDLRGNAIVCTAPSKTFNQAGLMNSNIWICDEKLRDVFNKEMACVVINGPSNFARAALMAAYGECEDWLEELIAYIRGNDAYVKQRLGEAFPRMNWSPLEGTYLSWTDWRGYFDDAESLERFARDKARITFDEGAIFGVGGAGFERWNLACPRRVLQRACDRFVAAAEGDSRFF